MRGQVKDVAATRPSGNGSSRAGSAGPSHGSPSGTQALDRAALLVATVVHADEPLSYAELQEESGLPKSTTSRLLSGLERTGLVERDGSGCYVAGRLFWLYATRHDPWEELGRLARPTLEAVNQETRETVHVAVARGDRVVHVGQVDSQYLLGTRDWTDVDVPAHASALGKVLLAHGALSPAPDAARLTARTVVGAELERDLRIVRERGWSTTLDELEVGLAAVAVPVLGPTGDVVAAIGVSGPTQRLEERSDEVARSLLQHAEGLSALLRRKTRTRDLITGDEEEGVA